MIFIDRSIPKDVAEALKRVRDDVLWLEDRFAHNARDEVWLATAGRCDWLVVTRDRRIRTRPGEIRSIISNKAGCFIITSKRNLKRWDYLKLLAARLDDMEHIFGVTKRPFIFSVDTAGRLRRLV